MNVMLLKDLKKQVGIGRVLEAYNLCRRLKHHGDQLVGPCPLHGGDNPTAFRVHLTRGLWNCFTACAGGDIVDLIRVIEDMSGQKHDMDKARAAIERTSQGLAFWKEFLGFARHRPSGITAFDSFVQMAPFLVARGTPQFAAHYKMLAEETEQRVADGIFPVPDEKYRLFWDNIPLWYNMGLFNYFEKYYERN